jgi:hypothetical protein
MKDPLEEYLHIPLTYYFVSFGGSSGLYSRIKMGHSEICILISYFSIDL